MGAGVLGPAAVAIMTALGLQALGTPPQRPGESVTAGALGERQGDLEQPPHLWDGQRHQRGFFPPTPPLCASGGRRARRAPAGSA